MLQNVGQLNVASVTVTGNQEVIDVFFYVLKPEHSNTLRSDDLQMVPHKYNSVV